jgi:hypothetical protein
MTGNEPRKCGVEKVGNAKWKTNKKGLIQKANAIITMTRMSAINNNVNRENSKDDKESEAEENKDSSNLHPGEEGMNGWD